MAIFECLDYHDDESFPNLLEVVGAFNEGLAKYRAGDFVEAERWFEQALTANPADAVAALYVERCRAFVESPPGADWDGTWVMTDK